MTTSTKCSILLGVGILALAAATPFLKNRPQVFSDQGNTSDELLWSDRTAHVPLAIETGTPIATTVAEDANHKQTFVKTETSKRRRVVKPPTLSAPPKAPHQEETPKEFNSSNALPAKHEDAPRSISATHFHTIVDGDTLAALYHAQIVVSAVGREDVFSGK